MLAESYQKKGERVAFGPVDGLALHRADADRFYPQFTRSTFIVLLRLRVVTLPISLHGS